MAICRCNDDSVACCRSCHLNNDNCSRMFLLIYITLYCALEHLVAWNVFWHIKESFLCIMLPSMNRFLNISHSNWQKKTVKIQILIAAWPLYIKRQWPEWVNKNVPKKFIFLFFIVMIFQYRCIDIHYKKNAWNSYHQCVLPKGRSFTASTGI